MRTKQDDELTISPEEQRQIEDAVVLLGRVNVPSECLMRWLKGTPESTGEERIKAAGAEIRKLISPPADVPDWVLVKAADLHLKQAS
ncbi:MAG: hypothetical protein O3C23_00850 [bacterium]|nr:hypothetical protein [bacterium]